MILLDLSSYLKADCEMQQESEVHTSEQELTDAENLHNAKKTN